MKNIFKTTRIKKVFTMKSKILIVFAVLSLSFAGCEYFENSDTLDISTIEVNITGLPALPDSMTYVGWLVSDDYDPVKIFVQDASDGSLHYKADQKFQSFVQAQQFVLTTEEKVKAGDSTLTPSTRKILGGRFTNAASTLKIGSSDITFNNLKAVYNLSTPTDGPETNELSGIWFADSLSTSPALGLDLPTLYSGWIYEGWIEINDQYVSTGRFTSPKARDLYAAHSDTLFSGYNFPGEDFLVDAPTGLIFPLNLANSKVIVSIEYNDGKDHGTSPFIKIFEGTVPTSAESKVSYSLQPTQAVLTEGHSVMVIDFVK